MKKEGDKNVKNIFLQSTDRQKNRKEICKNEERKRQKRKKCVEEGLNMFWVAI